MLCFLKSNREIYIFFFHSILAVNWFKKFVLEVTAIFLICFVAFPAPWRKRKYDFWRIVKAMITTGKCENFILSLFGQPITYFNTLHFLYMLLLWQKVSSSKVPSYQNDNNRETTRQESLTLYSYCPICITM